MAPTADDKPKAQKFTKNTKAYGKLKKMFEEKMISPTDKPANVRSKDPLFQDFTHQQFRSQFNKLRSEYGVCTKEGKCITVLVYSLCTS
jgi:hypothetical protein